MVYIQRDRERGKYLYELIWVTLMCKNQRINRQNKLYYTERSSVSGLYCCGLGQDQVQWSTLFEEKTSTATTHGFIENFKRFNKKNVSTDSNLKAAERK